MTSLANNVKNADFVVLQTIRKKDKKMGKCNRVCPYNTLSGCNVVEKMGICPYSNIKNQLFENPEQLVKTNDILYRNKKRYEVVIADDNIFVVCPVKYNKKEKSAIVKYTKAEIYANQSGINTLWELGFDTIKRSDQNAKEKE